MRGLIIVYRRRDDLSITGCVLHRLGKIEMADEGQPVQEVASAVGIPDANYMIKLFKAEFGETPAAYRKKYRV